MRQIRFAMIGGGWRAEFYARIARELPQRFALTGVLLRTPEKRAAWTAQWGGRAVQSLDELLADRPDFIVLSVAKGACTTKLIELMDCGVPILCETPPATDIAGLEAVWEAAVRTRARVQVAEQYPYQPLYASWKRIVDDGTLGEISNMSLSAVHSYHAVCLIRHFLNVGFANASITGRRYFFPVQRTDSREGVVLDGTVGMERRDRVTFVFDGGKTAFFDFSGVQYHSFIRTRHFSVQGTRGEIDDLTVRSLGEGNQPLLQRLERRDLGVNSNNHWSHYGMTLGERYVYLNPFEYARLNDDELAIAECLARMGALCEGADAQAYPLEQALQDAYFAIEMEEALTHPGETVRTGTQRWAR